MNDEILIQRLVDHELDAESRRTLVSGLSPDDPRWQSIALSFIEKQLLDESISELVHQPNFASPMPTTTSVAANANMPTSARNSMVPKVIWAIAASIALLASGFLLGQLQQKNNVAIDNSPTPNSAVSGDHSLQEMKLTDALARCVTPVPDQFRRDLLQAGYVLNEDQRMTKVELPFGGTVEVPIREYGIHYLGSNSFQ